MKLKDLLKVCSNEVVNQMQVYLMTEIGSALGLDTERVYLGDTDDREVLQRYLDYFVVCIEENYIVTIKGHKIA